MSIVSRQKIMSRRNALLCLGSVSVLQACGGGDDDVPPNLDSSIDVNHVHLLGSTGVVITSLGDLNADASSGGGFMTVFSSDMADKAYLITAQTNRSSSSSVTAALKSKTSYAMGFEGDFNSRTVNFYFKVACRVLVDDKHEVTIPFYLAQWPYGAVFTTENRWSLYIHSDYCQVKSDSRLFLYHPAKPATDAERALTDKLQFLTHETSTYVSDSKYGFQIAKY